MKTISEVCEIIGITRKTLRGYDEIGLLRPTVKAKGGNHVWLYDDNAIKTLALIQVFVEVGFDRKSIKKLLEEGELKSEIDKLITLLEQKRTRINGMINMAKQIKTAYELPSHILLPLSKAEVQATYQRQNLRKLLDMAIDDLSSFEDEHITDSQSRMLTSFYLSLVSLGYLKDVSITSPSVTACFVSSSRFVWNMVTSELDPKEIKEELKGMSQEEYGQMLSEICVEIITEQKLLETIDNLCGRGASEFILKVFDELRLKKPNYEMEDQ